MTKKEMDKLHDYCFELLGKYDEDTTYLEDLLNTTYPKEERLLRLYYVYGVLDGAGLVDDHSWDLIADAKYKGDA